jgi:hypothetical protein
MARPIGIFGALMALGGFLAVRYVQSRRAARYPSARELSRWEGEGGAVATPLTPSGSVTAQSVSPGDHGANGSPRSNGDGRAWPFPRG